MGAFFTNLQVRGSDVNQIAKALRDDALARGMHEVQEADEADRRVILLPPLNG